MKKLIITLLIFTVAIIPFSDSSEAHAQESILGEIKWFGFNFCPRGFVEADGQLMAISSHNALFSLFGTIYGGDGRTTFGIPDLRGRYAMHEGSGPALTSRIQGQKGGRENETLNTAQIPSHTHSLNASSDRATHPDPAGNFKAKSGSYRSSNSNMTSLGSGTIGSTGSGRPHNNMPPFVVVKACVAVVGIFPSRN